MIRAAQVLALASCLISASLAPVVHTKAATALVVHVTITPNPVPYGSYPTLAVQTAPSAICRISVLYSTGRGPSSYPPHTTQANAKGQIVEQGTWHMESSGTSGTATVQCKRGSRTGTGVGQFAIG